MIARLVAVHFAKYQVSLESLVNNGDNQSARLLCPVFIKSPSISRAFVEPLREYLYAEVKVDDSEWITGLWWPENAFRILADGDMVAMVLLLSKFTGLVTLGADYNRDIKDGKHIIAVRVARSVSDVIIVSREYEVVIDKRQIILPTK